MCVRRLVTILTIVLLSLISQPGGAQDSLSESAQGAWNVPGMAIPAATSAPAAGQAQCQSLVRPVESSEDALVAAQGWRLFSGYELGWGITLVAGFLNFDAMCRPVPYQYFVFVDGVFAGTLAPQPMYPRTDGAITDAGISSANRLYAIYDRYTPADPLCCPSDESVVTFIIEQTPNGPVVLPDRDVTSATPVAAVAGDASANAARFAVCVGLGGDALSVVYWTAEEIAAQEARTGPLARAHPETGSCTDPAGLPVAGGSMPNFSWACSRTFNGDWHGPAWVLDIYSSETDVPPDPAIGGCRRPRDQTVPQPPETEQAAATAVHLSQLEAAGDLDTLYAWLHPDAQAVVPKEAVTGWYNAEWLPRGPRPISVSSVNFGEWTWGVTGTTYPRTAEIAYVQEFADGSVAHDVVRLVQDEQGMWRWFFGREAGFVDDQIARFATPNVEE